jgi:hypothetical protein
MNTNKEQVVSLLLQGLSTSQIATACGVSDSYISQLRQDPEITAQLAEVAISTTLEDKQFDSRVEKAESLALERIEKSLGFANMGQALAAFKVLNSARKRQDSLPGQQAAGVTVNVNLTLPATASARYITNSNNEIVEVEGKTMISATVKSLDQLLALRAPQLAALERTANKLDGLQPPMKREPRRLPAGLSVDVL